MTRTESNVGLADTNNSKLQKETRSNSIPSARRLPDTTFLLISWHAGTPTLCRCRRYREGVILSRFGWNSILGIDPRGVARVIGKLACYKAHLAFPRSLIMRVHHQTSPDDNSLWLRVAELLSPHISATPAVSRARSGRQGSTVIRGSILKRSTPISYHYPLDQASWGMASERSPNRGFAALQD
ncbi:hypothetical protein VTN77DRAFT_7166 [Rasamsonia byssochlamydoides]|uniref:uncharacterized protein n=1 Tax=Rasamsonia byssochlamydoides TaxID=89139 RepID=UPI0037435A73